MPARTSFSGRDWRRQWKSVGGGEEGESKQSSFSCFVSAGSGRFRELPECGCIRTRSSLGQTNRAAYQFCSGDHPQNASGEKHAPTHFPQLSGGNLNHPPALTANEVLFLHACLSKCPFTHSCAPSWLIRIHLKVGTRYSHCMLMHSHIVVAQLVDHGVSS